MSWFFKTAFVLLFFGAPFAFKKFTCGFRLGKLLPASEIEGKKISSGYDEILSQPFTYLGRGCQAYVFVSADNRYVLKLFRRQKKEKRDLALLEGCRIADRLGRKETALVFLHLEKGEKGLPVATLRGPLRRTFQVPLDSVSFALQRRADPFQLSPKTAPLLRDFLEKRIEKGIVNLDRNIERNFGWLEGQIVEIDFGLYTYLPQMTGKERKQELARWGFES